MIQTGAVRRVEGQRVEGPSVAELLVMFRYVLYTVNDMSICVMFWYILYVAT